MVAVSGGDVGLAVQAQQADVQAPQRGHHTGRVSCPDLRFILLIGHVADPVKPVFFISRWLRTQAARVAGSALRSLVVRYTTSTVFLPFFVTVRRTCATLGGAGELDPGRPPARRSLLRPGPSPWHECHHHSPREPVALTRQHSHPTPSGPVLMSPAEPCPWPRLCKNCGYPVDKRRSRGITIAGLWMRKESWKDYRKSLAGLSADAVKSHSPPERQAASEATPRVSARPGDRVSRSGCLVRWRSGSVLTR